MVARILLTGCAGFIGFHTALRFVNLGHLVYGVDNLTSEKEISKIMKRDRLDILQKESNFHFTQGSIEDTAVLDGIFQEEKIDYVIHLAAKAGVRSPPEAAKGYINSNLLGFGNVISCCERFNVKHLIYASSSSVYGGTTMIPFSESAVSEDIQNLYAATKRSNELVAHAFATSFSVASTGLRFFTVYGPWSRPDMAVFTFARKIVNDEEIQVFGHGDLSRDFTYIDDAVNAIEGIFNKVNQQKPIGSEALPHRVLNVGRGEPRAVSELIEILENHLSIPAKKRMIEKPIQDVTKTHADLRRLKDYIGRVPDVSLEEGIKKFCDWFMPYHEQLPV